MTFKTLTLNEIRTTLFAGNIVPSKPLDLNVIRGV